MSVVQNVPNTRISGSHTFPLIPTDQNWTSAKIVIDRTVNGGLNSLTNADTLMIDFDYSNDGVNFIPFAGIVCVGGLIVTKGVTLAEDSLTLSSGVVPFPVGTSFQVRTNASTPVRITGTVTYS